MRGRVDAEFMGQAQPSSQKLHLPDPPSGPAPLGTAVSGRHAHRGQEVRAPLATALQTWSEAGVSDLPECLGQWRARAEPRVGGTRAGVSGVRSSNSG